VERAGWRAAGGTAAQPTQTSSVSVDCQREPRQTDRLSARVPLRLENGSSLHVSGEWSTHWVQSCPCLGLPLTSTAPPPLVWERNCLSAPLSRKSSSAGSHKHTATVRTKANIACSYLSRNINVLNSKAGPFYDCWAGTRSGRSASKYLPHCQ
jgi:hypothetical protein